MKTKEDFLLTYKIQEEDFKAADISWETLTKIHDDYKDKREKDYCDAGKRLSQTVFPNPKALGMHFIYWRVKEPDHLIAKIIRKRKDNYTKYKDIDENNYWKIVRDLIGFRGLMTFKDDWPQIHGRILSNFEDNRDLYIPEDDYTKYDRKRGQYLAEPVRAHIRDGDNKELYMKYLGSENIISKQNYRSVHYVLKCDDICVELQLRTLFEEALGEMDHAVRYPEYATDIKLNRYAGLMNHLVGLADELGSFYLELSNERKGTAPEEESQVERSEESFLAGGKPPDIQKMETPVDCLNNILFN